MRCLACDRRILLKASWLAALLLLLPAALSACGGSAESTDEDSQAGTTPSQPSATQQIASQPSATVNPTPAPQPTSAPAPQPPAAPVPQGSNPPPAQPQDPGPRDLSDVDPALVGGWRVYSARVFYDAGGGGDLSNVITTRLELSADGTWSFSSSSGEWSVSEIADDDWSRWGISPYGPTRKIELAGWNGDAADGPIEESGAGVDFLWVIYAEGPPTIGAPGTVWIKFGHP